MRKRQGAVVFGEVMYGRLVPPKGKETCAAVRFSTNARRLKASGATEEALAEFERDRKRAAVCPTHGELADPVIGLVGEGADSRVGFACPWCSGAEILAQWEAEGREAERS